MYVINRCLLRITGVIFNTRVFGDGLVCVCISLRVMGAIFSTYDFWATSYVINRCLLRITGVILGTYDFWGCLYSRIPSRITGVIFNTRVFGV